MGRGLTLLFATGTIALVAVACRQIVGIHDEGAALADASDGDGALACGLALAPGSCRACIESRCCSEAQRCGSAGEPACGAAATCELDCNGDPQCRSQCTLVHAIGAVSSLPALEACAARSCASECSLQCGGSLPNIPPKVAQGCEQCAIANACSAGALNNDPGTGPFVGLTIGAGQDSVNDWQGLLCEVLVYRGSMVDSDRANVESQLKARWGIP